MESLEEKNRRFFPSAYVNDNRLDLLIFEIGNHVGPHLSCLSLVVADYQNKSTQRQYRCGGITCSQNNLFNLNDIIVLHLIRDNLLNCIYEKTFTTSSILVNYCYCIFTNEWRL